METKPKKLPYPKSVFFIVANEFCERFSYYGMRTILSLYLRNQLGFSNNRATIVYHVFTMFAYFFPLVGAMIADGWLGRFRTILYLSLVYAIGSILMSITAIPTLGLPGVAFTSIALFLIAVGTGGIKPCVSAFGGDQFKLPEQVVQLSTFFSLFYFSINAGSLLSTFLTPMLRSNVQCFGENSCYSLAFGVPGMLMLISIVCFVAGKRWYIIKNPSGNVIGKFIALIGHALVRKRKATEKRPHWLDHADDKYDRKFIEDIKGVLKVFKLFIPLPVFWTLFDQQGSRWTFQADRMDQEIGSWTLHPDQIQVLNPFLILALIPICEVAIYPCLTKIRLIRKPLHKMILGGFLAAFAFVISGIVELQLLPTYGTPVSAGLTQLRVYNGFDCDFTLNLNGTNFNVSALGYYERLDIQATGIVELPYTLKGAPNTDCANVTTSGNFHLVEKTANSFFINKTGITDFVDNNGKAIDGFKIRFLTNTDKRVTIVLKDSKKDVVTLSVQSISTNQTLIVKGMYDILVDDKVIVSNYYFKHGAVYTVNLYEDSSGTFHANVVKITPENSVHILWLIPQYVVITLGEVMFSVTGLEFSFTQAPTSMKSVLQAAWLLTVALGNVLVVVVVFGQLPQWIEFFVFAALMGAVMLLFTFMALRYKYVTHSEDQPAEEMKTKNTDE